MNTQDKDRPEEGKLYALTGGLKDKCIMNGNTWAESEVICECGCHAIIARAKGCKECLANHA